MRIRRTVTVPASCDVVYDYLSDFTTTTQWDPGTVTTERVAGDGGLGTTYRNVSRFLGRTTELEYRVVVAQPPHRFVVVGRNRTVSAHDEMVMAPAVGGGCTLRYTATFTGRGLARFGMPFLAPAFRRLGDEAERGLAASLGAL